MKNIISNMHVVSALRANKIPIDILPKQLEKLLGKPPKNVVPLAIQTIVDLLDAWIHSDNYQKANKLGKQLDVLIKDIPPECRKVSSNVLYRGIAVDTSLLQKIKEGEKHSLFLENRKYSSWSYDLNAVKQFAKWMRVPEEKTYVILKCAFSQSSILLNVYSFMEYTAQHYPQNILFDSDTIEIATEKQEVIIKTSSKFEIEPHCLYLFMNTKRLRWNLFSEF
jgi:hypothetical protein